MIPLTDETILENLNLAMQSKIILLYIGIILFTLSVVCFIFFKLKHSSNSKIFYSVGMIIFSLFLIMRYDTINYSLKNNSWYVETDTVVRTKATQQESNITSYSIYLKNHGIFSGTKNDYHEFSNGDSVYLVIAKGRFGNTIPITIYSTQKYIYNQ